MLQVLFNIPIKTSLTPDGIPIHGFGLMLFFAFLICTRMAARKAAKSNIPPERIQDIGIVLFLSGIIGARIVFVIQYKVPWDKFLNIWEGGIVFYGSALGGFIGYWIFYYLVLKRANISNWRLADVLAPAIALGLAIGRVGCLLNGCCYGQVACEECPKIAFPLMTAPVRETVVDHFAYQTTVGFSIVRPDNSDVRSVVEAVEKDSAASRAGLQAGDRIIAFNDEANIALIYLAMEPGEFDAAIKWAKSKNLDVVTEDLTDPRRQALRVIVPDPLKAKEYMTEAVRSLRLRNNFVPIVDLFRDRLNNWPRGRQSLEFVVQRQGETVNLPSFIPRSLGLHPTQIYETISMILLLLVLVTFDRFRQHDGQVFVLLMVGYAIHRFLNEILRNDTPVEGFQMTLSQNGSVLLLVGALFLEIWLRFTQVNRWKKEAVS